MLNSFNLSRCLVSTLLLLVAVDANFLVFDTPAVSQETCPSSDRQPKAWLDNRSIQTFVRTPDSCNSVRPTDERPDIDVYLISPIDPNNPQALGGTFPLPPEIGGGFITVPMHDTTFSRWVPASQPGDCFGSYVLPGPNATSDTVQTRLDPNGSGLNLAYAIKFGDRFQPLTANWIVRAGVELGLLRLDPSIGFGGICWTD